jgi:hypothetical protein
MSWRHVELVDVEMSWLHVEESGVLRDTRYLTGPGLKRRFGAYRFSDNAIL